MAGDAPQLGEMRWVSHEPLYTLHTDLRK